jgi:hypothetical protein
MRSPEEIYWGYVSWCLKIGVPPMSRPAYEKAIASLNPTPNNTDAILRNNNSRKDKYDH